MESFSLRTAPCTFSILQTSPPTRLQPPASPGFMLHRRRWFLAMVWPYATDRSATRPPQASPDPSPLLLWNLGTRFFLGGKAVTLQVSTMIEHRIICAFVCLSLFDS